VPVGITVIFINDSLFKLSYFQRPVAVTQEVAAEDDPVSVKHQTPQAVAVLELLTTDILEIVLAVSGVAKQAGMLTKATGYVHEPAPGCPDTEHI
jgi:hypothetical protein